MNFANLTGISDDYGVVTQIADAAGRMIWSAVTNKPVILQVEKFTSDTYAGETQYTGEQFILLDIYPKTNGTVNVTYGGLTKTIADTSGAAEPNAQQVFFGTFNGVSDSVVTPASGELTIEGDYTGFAAGSFTMAKSLQVRCGCIKSVTKWGSITGICDYMFAACGSLVSITLPIGVKSIGSHAFDSCTNLASITLPSSIAEIRNQAFANCKGLTDISIPSGVISIGKEAFYNCTGLLSVTFDNIFGWYVTETENATSGTAVTVTDPTNNVTHITIAYSSYYWYRS